MTRGLVIPGVLTLLALACGVVAVVSLVTGVWLWGVVCAVACCLAGWVAVLWLEDER